MLDIPPVPWPVAIAVIGWGVAVLGLTWRASSKLSTIESRLTHVEGEVANDVTGRKGVNALQGDVREIKTRLDGQERMLERIEAKLDAR